MRIQVKDFMSSPVTTAVSEDKISDIRNIMRDRGIHAIPIIQYAKKLPSNEVTISGIVTMTDITKNVAEDALLEEIMTSNVHVVHKNSSAQAAAKMMLKHEVHHIVVMDDGEIIGMVSSTDFVKLVAEHTLD